MVIVPSIEDAALQAAGVMSLGQEIDLERSLSIPVA
jgi:hypothetical protein